MTVEIVTIIDRSGSMESIKAEAIGALNTFIENQQATPGEANITSVLFNDQYEMPEYRTPLANAMRWTDQNFTPRGFTAMNDAIGRTITEFKRLHTEGKLNAEGVVVCIVTDGLENASREYSAAQVKALIEQSEKEYGWNFVFLAANQDAFATGATLGIRSANTSNYTNDAAGYASVSNFMSASVSSYRSQVASRDIVDQFGLHIKPEDQNSSSDPQSTGS